MAESCGLVYSRYVDDITLSGPFDLRESGFPGIVRKVLEGSGFLTNQSKDQFGRIGDPDVLITKIRINRGRVDVSRKYFDDLCCVLCDLRQLGHGGDFTGRYFTSGQMWGRIQFVSWIRPGRRLGLVKLYKSVPWDGVREQAIARRLVVCKKTLVGYWKQHEKQVPDKAER